MISYAENFEDVYLERYFKNLNNGIYIDIGAEDPVSHSVTKHFQSRGWTGLNITFRPEFLGALNSARPSDRNVLLRPSEPEEILKEIIKYINKNPDFLRISAEGNEAAVLRALLSGGIRPDLFLIRCVHGGRLTSADTDLILNEYNYISVLFDGLNRYYIPEARSSEKSLFELPPNVNDSFVSFAGWNEKSALLYAKSEAERFAKEAEFWKMQTEKLLRSESYRTGYILLHPWEIPRKMFNLVKKYTKLFSSSAREAERKHHLTFRARRIYRELLKK